jgi:hypothetical protein
MADEGQCVTAVQKQVTTTATHYYHLSVGGVGNCSDGGVTSRSGISRSISSGSSSRTLQPCQQGGSCYVELPKHAVAVADSDDALLV